MQRVVPLPGVQDVIDAVRDAQSMAWAAGLTGIHEITDNEQMVAFQAFQALRREGELGLRVSRTSLPLDCRPSPMPASGPVLAMSGCASAASSISWMGHSAPVRQT